MSANNHKLLLQITSPLGIAVYPRLNEPDTKFDADGVYQVQLSLTQEEAKPFLEKVKKHLDVFFKETKKTTGKAKLAYCDSVPWKACEMHDGNISIRFKQKAKIKNRKGEEFELDIQRFNKKGEAIDSLIGGGSTIQVATDVYPWYNPSLGVGVTLRIKAVMVHDLHSPSAGGKAEDYGFSVEEVAVVEGGESFPDSLFAQGEEGKATADKKPDEPKKPEVAVDVIDF